MNILRLLRQNKILLIVLIINLLLTIITNQITLRDFQNSADEYSYYLSAKIFSIGKLSMPPPPNKEFFTLYHVISEDKFYSKYPPGWPFFLSLGILLHRPWLINIIFSTGTLLVIYLIAKDNFSKKIADTTLLLTLVNPFLIFNSASYFSNPSCLFFISLFTYFFFKSIKEKEILKNFAFMGISGGIAFLIRPFTALVIISPLMIYLLVNQYKEKHKKLTKKLLVFSLSFSIFISILLLYNYIQTGNPLLQPFIKYKECDKLGLTSCSNDFQWGIKNNLINRLILLNQWMPLSPILLLVYLTTIRKNYLKSFILFIIFIILFSGYLFYLFDPGNEYGPRYLYEASFALFILNSITLSKLKKIGKILLIIIILFNIISFFYFTDYFKTQVNERMQLYDLVKENNLSNAIIFLQTGTPTMSSGDLKRNDIYFNQSVLYASDLKEHNKELLKTFPNRTFYYFYFKEKGYLVSLNSV